MAENILSVEKLKIGFWNEKRVLTAVEDISFEVQKGKTLCIVGESGCGKSVTATSILRLWPQKSVVIQGGSILFHGQDLTKCGPKQMDQIRENKISMIFQEPMTSLNPVYTVGKQLMEIMLAHPQDGIRNKKEAKEYAIEMLKRVGIPSPGTRFYEYPHQLSGGMRQRVMIAMALSCRPDILIADEPTTALDVTIQAQILKLMSELQRDYNTGIILITHDMGVVARTADEVMVMYAGTVVEKNTAENIFDHTRHPYTQGLLRSIPRPDRDLGRLYTIEGQVPALTEIGKGCRFASRCPHCTERCRQEEPTLEPTGDGGMVRCYLSAGEERRRAV